MNGDGNGNGAQHGDRPNGAQRITISFAPETFKMHIDFDTQNWDVAIAMLDQARRFVDGKLRIAAAIAMQQELADAARTKAIVDSVANKGMRG